MIKTKLNIETNIFIGSENSNKEIRKFVISSPQQLNHVANVKAIQWEDSGVNIWGEQINLVSATHCGIGMKVYNKVMYLK